MKNLLEILFLSVVTTCLHGQTTITGTSPVGYAVKMSIADAATATTAPLNVQGPNVVWDCRNLVSSSSGVDLRIENPLGRPFADQFPSSNWNMNAYLGSTLLYNDYFILSPDSLVLLGGRFPGSKYEIYDNAQLDMKFPFSYGNSVVDGYSKTSYNADGMVTSSQTGTLTLSYVGYGTLILPVGTFNNVALLKKERTNSIGPTTFTYSWVTIPGGERLMEYNNNGGIKLNYASSIACPSPFVAGGQPKDVEATVGDTVRFSVEVSLSEAQYGWYCYNGKDWAVLSDDDSYSGVGTRVLTIKNISVSATGYKYRCTVRSTQCTWNTSAAALSVCGEPIQHPLNATVREGDSVYFEAKSNDSRVQYSWQVNDGSGYMTCDTTRFSILAGGQRLVIKQVPLSLNNSHYRCLMKAPDCGTDTTTEATLFVNTVTSVNGGEEDDMFSFILSPNPATITIAIHTPRALRNKTCTIMNSLGEVVAVYLVNDAAPVFDISSLPNGPYILRIDNHTKSFVVSH